METGRIPYFQGVLECSKYLFIELQVSYLSSHSTFEYYIRQRAFSF